MQYRKKPVVIDAIQYISLNSQEIESFVGKTLKMAMESETAYVADQGAPIFSLIIPTLEGNMKVMPGDYVIRGIANEYYPCKEAIFHATYEPVEQ